MRISVRVKLGLTLFLAVAAFLGVDHVLRNIAFRGAFSELDSDHAELEIAGAHNVLRDLIDEMSLSARVADVKAMAAGSEIDIDRADLVLLVERSGKVLARRMLDPKSREPMELREVPTDQLATSHPLLFPWRQRQVPEGFLETKYGFFAIGSAEHAFGDSQRLLVLGRLLTADRLDELSLVAGSTFELTSLYGTDPNGAIPPELLDSIGAGKTVIRRSEGENGAAYASVEDLRGLPSLALRAKLKPPVWKELESYELLTSAAVALIFPLILLVLLQIVVTGPLARLTSLASEIGESNDSTLRVRMDRRDEIGTLSATFDAMLDEIERSRIAQARTARVAGRSEVAVGVMHNVGNLVNSIQVSASIARDRAEQLGCDDLRTILETLRANEGGLDRYLAEDPRGTHLLSFFEAALTPLEESASTTQRESCVVLENVEQIGRLIHSLQGTESHEEVVDRIEVTREIDSAIEMAIDEITEADGIQVERNFDGPCHASIDRQRVHEVLVALLLNARDAVLDSPAGARTVLVESTSLPTGRSRIRVSDSGAGIPAESRSGIFEMGYSTKADASGLGLHLASLAANELGGQVTLEDESVLSGATFTFEFPLERCQEPRSLISAVREAPAEPAVVDHASPRAPS